MGGRRKASDAHPPARGDWGPPGGWVSVGSLPTATHRRGGTPPSEGGVPPGRWAEPNYPSVINKPAAARPNASDNSMTEATSMLQGGRHHKGSEATVNKTSTAILIVLLGKKNFKQLDANTCALYIPEWT